MMPRFVRVSARTLVVVALIGMVGLLAACGSARSDESDPAPDDDSTVVEVTITGGTVQPADDVVTVRTGQKVELEVKADQGGALRLHSDPSRVFRYSVGTTHIKLGSFDEPGRIDVDATAVAKTVCILDVH